MRVNDQVAVVGDHGSCFADSHAEGCGDSGERRGLEGFEDGNRGLGNDFDGDALGPLWVKRRE